MEIPRPTTRALTYLFFLLALVGCASKEIEESINATLKDPAKAEMVLREFNEEKALMISLKDEQTAYINELQKLNADYNTPDHPFEVFFSSLNVRTAALQQNFLQRHMSVRNSLSEDEWKKVNKAMLSAAVKSFKEVLK